MLGRNFVLYIYKVKEAREKHIEMTKLHMIIRERLVQVEQISKALNLPLAQILVRDNQPQADRGLD